MSEWSERESTSERYRDKQTDRQTDRQTKRQSESETGREEREILLYQIYYAASKHCKTPIFGVQEVYDRLKSHIAKPEEFAVCLKLPSDVVSVIMKTHPVDAALEAVISKWAEDEKKACWDNIVRALGCMKTTTLAVQIAVEYGFGPQN